MDPILNATLKKPTPLSKLRGIYGFFRFGTGCHPTRYFFRILQSRLIGTGNDQVQLTGPCSEGCGKPNSPA